jgi:hypothetical protein
VNRRGGAIGWAAIDTLTCLILVIYTLIAPPVKVKIPTIPTAGAYAITQTCPADNPVDIDLYVRDPQGNIAYFNSTTAGLMHLEQDVIPGVNTVDGNVNLQTGDNERTVILQTIPGEYAVDEHYYATNSGHSPVTCIVQLWSLRDASEITSQTITLPKQGSVATAFRFVIGSNGHIRGINHLPVDFVDTLPGATQ